MFSLFILFCVQIMTQNLLPKSQCLGNCLSCNSGDLAICSNDNNDACQEGFYFNQNLSTCLINPNFNSSYTSQQLPQQNNKNSLIPPVGWTQSVTTQCLYIDDNGNQQYFNVLGPYKQIISTYKYFNVNPQHSVYLISFNLIRNQWLPFNDFLVVDIQNNKKLLNSLQISYDKNPNAVSSMPIICGGKSVITQKFTIKIINKLPASQIKVTFTGFLFNSIWGLTNIKFTSGCNKFSVFNQKTQNCDLCDRGYYSAFDINNVMTCIKCSYQCLTCSSSNICSSCISGYVFTSVTKNCIKDQGINQLPFVSSYINQTISFCVDRNLSYVSIPFNGSLTSATYINKNNLNLGNISIVFQFYYNTMSWVNSTNVAQIFANGVLFTNITNINLTNKGSIQCSGKNSTMTMMKFSISSPYQFNTSNIILTFNISGNQNISYGVNNVTVFSTPNYNNVKLYTRDQLIQMMNPVVQSNIQSNNYTANLPVTINSSKLTVQSLSSSNTSNISITSNKNSTTQAIPANNSTISLNFPQNSSKTSIQSSTLINKTVNTNPLQNISTIKTNSSMANNTNQKIESITTNTNSFNASALINLFNTSSSVNSSSNYTAQNAKTILINTNENITQNQSPSQLLVQQNVSSSIENIIQQKQNTSKINSIITNVIPPQTQQKVKNNAIIDQNSNSSFVNFPNSLSIQSSNSSFNFNSKNTQNKSEIITTITFPSNETDNHQIIQSQISVITLNQSQSNQTKINNLDVNQTESQNSTKTKNQSQSQQHSSTNVNINANITKKLQIPNNTVTVQYVQFAQNGNSGIKIKISNASLYTGYNLYASVLKLSKTSRTNFNSLLHGEIIDDHFIGIINLNESFIDSQVQIFGVSDQKNTSNDSIIRNQTINARLLQQEITIQFTNIAEFKVDRFDFVETQNQQSMQSLANSFTFFVWFAIIGIILLSFIGKSAIFEDFVVALQILFLNTYLFTSSLPSSIINSFVGLQRIEKMNYFQSSSLNWLENLLLGDQKQDSPIQFTVFNVDINFTRAILPILVLNLIFLIWFFILFLIQMYAKKQQEKLVHNQPSQNLKLIQKITNRKMNFVDQIWKYEFIPVTWACLKQFHNFQYPQNNQNGQILNTLFCLITFIGILVWPAIVIIYTRRIYYQRQYIEYFQSFKQIFYHRIPQDHLPSIHQRAIYPIFKTVKLLIFVILLSIFIDFPLITLIAMLVIVSLEIFYLSSYEIYQNKFCLWFKIAQCSIQLLLWAFLILIWSLSSTVQSDGYLAMGYVFVALSFFIILNGGAQSGYLGWKQFGKFFKIKKSEQEQQFNVEQPQQILKSYRVV